MRGRTKRARHLVILVAVIGCGNPSLQDYQDHVAALRKPIEVTRVEPYLDFGSCGFTVRDARGRDVSFCLQGVAARDTSGPVDRQYPIGFLHIGDWDWQRGRSIPVAPNSSLEDALLSLMQAWVRERFPMWTGDAEIPHIPQRMEGAVTDSLATIAFLGAIRAVEQRRALLGEMS